MCTHTYRHLMTCLMTYLFICHLTKLTKGNAGKLIMLRSHFCLCFTGHQLSVSLPLSSSPVLIRINCQCGSRLVSSLRVAIQAEAGFETLFVPMKSLHPNLCLEVGRFHLHLIIPFSLLKLVSLSWGSHAEAKLQMSEDYKCKSVKQSR